jgi:lysophospholipase L1-like esterase
MPGAKYAIVFEGVNDIGTAATDEASQKEVGDRLIAAFDQIITRLHRFNIPVFGATITPIIGSQSVYNDPAMEATRQRVNEWIRSSGRFDAVIDFDEAVRDPENSEQLIAEYDSGDNLHLSPAGYKAMADAVDLTLFKKFKNGI